MRRALTYFAILAAGLATGAAGPFVLAGASPQPESERSRSVTLEVLGMHSPMCEIAVKSTLQQLEGVQAVTVDRPGAAVDVSFDPAVASPASFTQAVGALGFRASLPEERVEAETAASAAHVSATSRLTPEQIELVAGYVTRRVVETREIPDGETIAEATGVALSIADTPVLQQAILAKLADDPRGRELLAGSRCSDYGACSVWGNLVGASGEMLELYEREKALDGTTYEDRELPAFEALDLEGRPVSSADLLGRPAVLVLLSVHCTHSMQTFPILQQLHRRYSDAGLQVLGVLVNSGSVEDANGWVPHFAPEHPVWVSQGDSLGDLLGSHLVPTYLLVDEEGNVRELLVGFHDRSSVVAELRSILPD